MTLPALRESRWPARKLHHAKGQDLAAASGDDGCVRMILVHDCVDVNAADESGWTALHWATFCSHIETAMTLMKNGANLKARDLGGYTPLDRAGPYRGEIEEYWERINKLK